MLHLVSDNDHDAKAVLYLTAVATTVERYRRAVDRAPPAVRDALQAEFDPVRETGETAQHALDTLPVDDGPRHNALVAGVEKVQGMVDAVERVGWTGWSG
jgi:hypothetical protein